VSGVSIASVTTRLGIAADVRVYDQDPGGASVPIIYFHGTTGLFDDEPTLSALSKKFQVYAPTLPGYGPESADSGETQLDDMLAITLHAWDLVDAIKEGAGLAGSVHLVGQDVGAMIVAEMAAVARNDVARIGLISPLGMWAGDAPIPDIFAMLPFEFPAALFSDVALGTQLLTAGLDFEDPQAIEAFQVRNSRRLGFMGKLLFPVPNRRLSTRAYRIAAPTHVVWGANDKLTPTDPYRQVWDAAIPGTTSTSVDDAGHSVHVEQPAVCAQIIGGHLAG
jgi:pimeloyl-ACP methyl ester carboxylesterase